MNQNQKKAGQMEKSIFQEYPELFGCLTDLHLHLDGSLSVQTVRKLAAMEGISLPEQDQALRERLQVPEDCTDLNAYLKMFDLPVSLLQTEAQISESVYCLQEELKKQGLMYAEIRFAPQLHTEKGMSQTQVVEAALKGLNRSDFHAGLILCCMRMEDNRQGNLETVAIAAKYRNQGVVALDLAGAEGLFKTECFEEEFSLARQLEVPFTIHAGEADGPESIKKAIAFGAARIGHGVRAIEDPALVEVLKKTHIPLEMCPTSNLNTRVVEDLKEYPLVQYMNAGVRVTVNTDNEMVSNTTVARELALLQESNSLTVRQMKEIVQNGVEASFADERQKVQMRKKIEQAFENYEL